MILYLTLFLSIESRKPVRRHCSNPGERLLTLFIAAAVKVVKGSGVLNVF